MSYLELAKQVLTERAASPRPKRCSECDRLEHQGVTVLHCAECGYEAPAGAHPAPRPGDLIYPLSFVRKDAPSLYEPYLGRFRYWTSRFEAAGWTREDAERAAYRQVMLSPPAPLGQE
jgi:hypothetical protein